MSQLLQFLPLTVLIGIVGAAIYFYRRGKRALARREEQRTVIQVAETMADPNQTARCPYCGEFVLAIAKKCKHCGEFLDESLRRSRAPEPQPKPRLWSPGVAAVLSVILPGAGQIYKGQIASGILWMVAVAVGYALGSVVLFLPGIILHICCIVSASRGDPTQERGRRRRLARGVQ